MEGNWEEVLLERVRGDWRVGNNEIVRNFAKSKGRGMAILSETGLL